MSITDTNIHTGGPRKGTEPICTPMQALFCELYVVDLDSAKAYLAAGYKSKTASSTSSKLRAKPHVAAYIERLKAQLGRQTGVDAEYVLNRLREIDQLDILDIMDGEMESFLPIRRWPKAWRISINAIDIKRIIESSNGKGKASVETIIEKIKWPDKTKNLELLGRHISVKAFEGEAGTEDKPVCIKFVRATAPKAKD